jgi:hypothetical protein
VAELLELQHDLAAAVLWLDRNWTSDLPAPTIYGLQLQVVCPTVEVCERASARLRGAPAFGRVSIEACAGRG